MDTIVKKGYDKFPHFMEPVAPASRE